MSLRFSAYVWSITTYYVIQPYYRCLTPKRVFSCHFSCQKHKSKHLQVQTCQPNLWPHHLTIYGLIKNHYFASKKSMFWVVLIVGGPKLGNHFSICVSTKPYVFQPTQKHPNGRSLFGTGNLKMYRNAPKAHMFWGEKFHDACLPKCWKFRTPRWWSWFKGSGLLGAWIWGWIAAFWYIRHISGFGNVWIVSTCWDSYLYFFMLDFPASHVSWTGG